MHDLVAVITTIQPPTAAVEALLVRLRNGGHPLVVVGDRKGPASFSACGSRFLDIETQLASRFDLARLGPVGHYTRKNVGYLEAVSLGAQCIYETDDDNAPLDRWVPRKKDVQALALDHAGWVNVYRCFSRERIWPRGLPLDEVVASLAWTAPQGTSTRSVRAPIQQGLANGAPDVDAVWRLVLDRSFDFEDGPSVVLSQGAWCPFNSQSTWWWPEAYPLLYLPSFCSFRMTDIWRSFVAQRCLWELGLGVVFHAAEVIQNRNLHNLMRDFNDEIPGYQRNRELVNVLADTALLPGAGAVADNLQRCYEALVRGDFFDPRELDLLAAWRTGLEQAVHGY
jgi:STELLO glycosyltransferases